MSSRNKTIASPDGVRAGAGRRPSRRRRSRSSPISGTDLHEVALGQRADRWDASTTSRRSRARATATTARARRSSCCHTAKLSKQGRGQGRASTAGSTRTSGRTSAASAAPTPPADGDRRRPRGVRPAVEPVRQAARRDGHPDPGVPTGSTRRRSARTTAGCSTRSRSARSATSTATTARGSSSRAPAVQKNLQWDAARISLPRLWAGPNWYKTGNYTGRTRPTVSQTKYDVDRAGRRRRRLRVRQRHRGRPERRQLATTARRVDNRFRNDVYGAEGGRSSDPRCSTSGRPGTTPSPRSRTDLRGELLQLRAQRLSRRFRAGSGRTSRARSMST